MEILNWLLCWASSKDTLSRTFSEMWRYETETSPLEIIRADQAEKERRVNSKSRKVVLGELSGGLKKRS